MRILRIDVPLSANRQFQPLCSEHFPGLADILDCLAADQLWALVSMRVQLANSDQLQAQSAAVRFSGLGRRYVLVAFNDRPVGLLSHADGSSLLSEARPKLTALSREEIRLALMLDVSSIRQHIEAVGKAIHQPGGRAQRDATNERQVPTAPSLSKELVLLLIPDLCFYGKPSQG